VNTPQSKSRLKKVHSSYNAFSPVARRVIAALLRMAPDEEEPFNVVLSSLSKQLGCSRISVLRAVPKGEKAGLYTRKVNDRGPRYGTQIMVFAKCRELFLDLFCQDYGLIEEADNDTDHIGINGTSVDRYHCPVFIPTLEVNNPADLFFSRCSVQGRMLLQQVFSGEIDTDHIGINMQQKAKEAGCSEVTARRVINNGAKAGLYDKKLHPHGPRYGVVLTLNKDLCSRLKNLLDAAPVTITDRVKDTIGDRYLTDPDTNHVTYPDRYHSDHDTYQDTNQVRYHDTDQVRYQNQPQKAESMRIPAKMDTGQDTDHVRYQNRSLDRQIKTLSILNSENLPPDQLRHARRILDITDQEIEVLWPELSRCHFGTDQLRQIVKYRLEFELPLDDIIGSLHAAHWDLEHDSFPQANKGVLNYLFATLKAKGTFRRPAGYRSPEELALDNARRELRAAQELEMLRRAGCTLPSAPGADGQDEQNSAKDDAFSLWEEALSDEERTDVLEKCQFPKMPEERWLKTYWMTNVCSAEPKSGECAA
jgi:DNA-binding MarR family transcriptional regulator